MRDIKPTSDADRAVIYRWLRKETAQGTPVSEPTPSIEQLNDDLSTWDSWVEVGNEARSQRIWGMLDELAALRTENAELRDLAHEQDTVLREKAQECDALRAQVAEQTAWRERAERLLYYVAAGDEPRLPGYHAEDEAIANAARALLGEGGQR